MYFVSLQALGDIVISVSLLKQTGIQIKVLGTAHTENIVDLLDIKKNISVIKLYDDIPAFYNIKKSNIMKILLDIIKFRSYIKKHNITELVFEKKDFRSTLLTFGMNVKIYVNNEYSNVYKNRQSLIENVYNKKINILDNKRNIKSITKTVLINPSSRVKKKDITQDNLLFIVELLKKSNIRVTLVDYNKEYKSLENIVDKYLIDTSLIDVKKLIIDTDLYIGADSFLIHLANYFNIPYFIVFNEVNEEFLPLHSLVVKNYIVTDDSFHTKLKIKFKQLEFIS